MHVSQNQEHISNWSDHSKFSFPDRTIVTMDRSGKTLNHGPTTDPWTDGLVIVIHFHRIFRFINVRSCQSGLFDDDLEFGSEDDQCQPVVESIKTLQFDGIPKQVRFVERCGCPKVKRSQKLTKL